MKLNDEIWKNIDGYEGLYKISNIGNVKSLSKFIINSPNGVSGFQTEERILLPQVDKKGYLYYQLYKENKRKCFKAHRLVAIHFIPNPENLPQINHKDEVKTNNTVENLEWCTNSYNHWYGTVRKRIGDKNTNHPSKSTPINQFSLDGYLIKTYPSMQEAQRQGFQQSGISRCCDKKQKQHKGFIWRYADD